MEYYEFFEKAFLTALTFTVIFGVVIDSFSPHYNAYDLDRVSPKHEPSRFSTWGFAISFAGMVIFGLGWIVTCIWY